MTGLLDLIWQNNTAIGRVIISAITLLGCFGILCAAAHWQRYTSSERRWLDAVRGRLRRSEDANQATGTVELRELAEGIPRQSLIGDRLDTILRLKQARVKVNLATLQQSSVLKESAKWSLSFPAFIVSLVMMLGLLGTFVGLSFMVADIQRALPNPAVQANATEWAQSVSSLGRILAGKKTAFSATLVGIFFSIAVSLFNFGLARSQSAFYDLLERFTTEELLPATLPAFEDETPWEKLSRQLGDSFENLQSLATAQARSAEQMAALEATFGTVIENIETITQRAAMAPLQSAAGEITNVVGQLTRVQDAILALTERLPQIVTSFRQMQQSAIHEIQSSTNAQQGAVERLTRTLQSSHSATQRWGLAAGGAMLAVVVMLVLRAIG